ncbi:MAG: glycerate kinase [Candidatus Heteroscillospira sp.]|jgi:glycerate kinase
MKFLFAPDSFKGSLSSKDIIRLLTEEAEKIFPGCECVSVPMADGGEGTMEVLVDINNGKFVTVPVKGPLFEDVDAVYGVLDENTAIIEMAAASGLPMVPNDKRDPMNTTTYGTGELIRHALDAGYRNIIIGVGGSATNDGGIGCMGALGVKFLDKNGQEVYLGGKGLAEIADIDVSGLHPAAKDTKFTVMCDVTFPLLGPKGATYVFGPQKGADEARLVALEAGMENYVNVINAKFGEYIGDKPSTGAAGGLSAALMVFLKAQLQSGIDTVLQLSDFDKKLEGVDVVISGEGRADHQSANGKVLYGVGTSAMKRGIPAIAIVGSMLPGAESLYDCGITSIIPTVNGIMKLDDAIANAEELFRGAAYRTLMIVKAGYEIKK